jgi:AcrR family transcriptional regulator
MPPRDRTKRRVIPNQERAQASIDAILTAASQLLEERGFTRMTTNGIATRAGVNVSLVYRYFAGKEAIVGVLIERSAAALESSMRDTLAEHARSPLTVAIRAMLDALAAVPSAPALHRELVEHVDLTRRRQLIQDLRTRLMVLFTEFMALRSAEIRPLVDRDATLFVLQHAIEAATHAAAFYRADGLSLDRALDALTELVVRSLSPVQDPPFGT